MREFLLKSGGRTGDFSLNDLPGAGRMDIACRCITACLWLSDELRKDSIFHLLLEGPPAPPKLLTFNPLKLKRFYPDERNVASHIRLALLGKPQPGISLKTISFKDFLEEQRKQKQIIILDSKGKDIRKIEISDNVLFILGDNRGIGEDIEGEKVSVGKKVYLSSQVISIIQNELDRREEQWQD
jgi:tRNA (pseudouridine54-N1)-methyltransferase